MCRHVIGWRRSNAVGLDVRECRAHVLGKTVIMASIDDTYDRMADLNHSDWLSDYPVAHIAINSHIVDCPRSLSTLT
jgi:hypothetical protein